MQTDFIIHWFFDFRSLKRPLGGGGGGGSVEITPGIPTFPLLSFLFHHGTWGTTSLHDRGNQDNSAAIFKRGFFTKRKIVLEAAIPVLGMIGLARDPEIPTSLNRLRFYRSATPQCSMSSRSPGSLPCLPVPDPALLEPHSGQIYTRFLGVWEYRFAFRHRIRRRTPHLRQRSFTMNTTAHGSSPSSAGPVKLFSILRNQS